MKAMPVVVAALAALIPCASAQQTAWEPVGLCGGGGLFNPSISPHDSQTIMTESDMGGRYISRDGGQTWQMLHHQNISAACRGAPPLFHPTRPGLIYALSEFAANILYVSRDNGKTWKQWDDQRQPKTDLIRRMFIDPALPDRLFLGSASGRVLYTDDEGRTWQQSQGVQGSVIQFIVEKSSSPQARTYWVGTSQGVFRSDDGGRAFVRKTAGLPEGKDLTGFAGGSNEKATNLYACTPCWLEEAVLAGGVYVSTDRGETWQRRMTPKINVQTQRTSPWAQGDLPRYSHFVANDAEPRRAYVYCGGTSFFPPNHSTIYRTDDAGQSWTDVWFVDPRFEQCNVAYDWMTSFTHQSWAGRPISMEISPVDPDSVIRTDGMFLFHTTDGGKSWKPGHAVKATDATQDKDITWRNNGLVNTTTWNYYIDPHEPNRHYIAYTDIGFVRSLDGGRTWRWWGPGPPATDTHDPFTVPRAWVNTCYELAFDPDIPGKIWGAFSGHHDIPNENSIWRGTGKSRFKGGICLTTDFGVVWQAQPTGLPEAPALSVVLDPASPKGRRTLYAAIYDHGVFKSTDDGATWTDKSKGLGHPDNMRICRVFLHPDGTLFALITGMRVPANGPFIPKGVGLYRSRDRAETWELVNKDYPLLYPKDFGVDPQDSKVIYIGACDAPDGPNSVARQGGLYRTTDGGKTWQLVMRKRATHFGAYFHPRKKGWIYATTTGWSEAPEGTLWLSKDNGKTWTTLAGIPFAQTQRVHFDPADDAIIYVTTFGGSVWKGPAQ